jgi:hypothetical protein
MIKKTKRERSPDEADLSVKMGRKAAGHSIRWPSCRRIDVLVLGEFGLSFQDGPMCGSYMTVRAAPAKFIMNCGAGRYYLRFIRTQKGVNNWACRLLILKLETYWKGMKIRGTGVSCAFNINLSSSRGG